MFKYDANMVYNINYYDDHTTKNKKDNICGSDGTLNRMIPAVFFWTFKARRWTFTTATSNILLIDLAMCNGVYYVLCIATYVSRTTAMIDQDTVMTVYLYTILTIVVYKNDDDKTSAMGGGEQASIL